MSRVEVRRLTDDSAGIGGGINSLPTTVSVSPSSFNIAPDETEQLTATVENGSGDTTWESSDTDVATVSSSGLVTGVAEGSVTITATNNGVSDTASGTVAESSTPAGWRPNDPGYSTIHDLAGNTHPYTGFGHSSSSLGAATVVSDADFIDGQALEIDWSEASGQGTNTHRDTSPNLGDVNRLYMCLELKFSNPFRGHSTRVNKWGFLWSGGSPSSILSVESREDEPLYIALLGQNSVYSANGGLDLIGTLALVRGQRHVVEYEWIHNSPGITEDGELRMWVDGELAGEWLDMQYGESGTFLGNPLSVPNCIYGGVGDWPAVEGMYVRYGRLYLSGANV